MIAQPRNGTPQVHAHVGRTGQPERRLARFLYSELVAAAWLPLALAVVAPTKMMINQSFDGREVTGELSFEVQDRSGNQVASLPDAKQEFAALPAFAFGGADEELIAGGGGAGKGFIA